MYRKILVPVDGSKTSLLGLEHAIALAGDQQASVRILNVVDEMVLTTMMAEPVAVPIDDILESMRADGRKVLDKALARAQKAGVKAEAVQVASRGRAVSDVILAEARRARADVIVMGTHGRRGLNRLLLGSDAERVLRDAPVPVLLTRRSERKSARSSKAAGRRGTASRT
ncbi:MAG: universal stress protein [Burkholderiales bacterium]|nr:universal stress protein [Burkholderiales bacterium]